LFACRESHFSAYLTLWFPLLIWWTPLCLIRQILTRRFRLYAYIYLFRTLNEVQEITKVTDYAFRSHAALYYQRYH
ncbi:hypothetical protein, partial [Klebsiella pneumoniae]|uniref:hypothetical protein n=1 Tax=Klebsiella pneumoniae TaxID=573 RepID=UPI001FAB0039